METGCIYIPDFPAWTFQYLDPTLPRVAVYEKGVIIARNHGLRRVITPGNSLEQARSFCPDATFFMRDYLKESAVWEEVIRHINRITPRLKPLQPGWALLKPYDRSELQNLVIALKIQAAIAPDHGLARMAAVRAAPGNVLHVRKTDIPGFMEQWTVDNLPPLGFEEEMIERLKLFGLTSAERLVSLTRRHLEAQFAEAGVRLYHLIHPDVEQNIIPLFRPPPVIVENYELDDAPQEPGSLLDIVRHLLERAVHKLERNRCRRLTLRLHGWKESGLSESRILKSPTNNNARLFTVLEGMVTRLLKRLTDLLRIQSITIEFGSLSHPVHQQSSLFFERPSVRSAIKAVHERFPGKIQKAVVTHADDFFHEEAAYLEDLLDT